MLDRRQVRADLVDDAGIFVVGDHNFDAGVVDDVLVVGGDEAEVERHEDGADLGHRVVALEEEVRVGAEQADAVAGHDAEREQGVGDLVDALLEVAVGEAAGAVDYRGLVGIKLGGSAEKIIDEERDFHRAGTPWLGCERLYTGGTRVLGVRC